MSTAVHLSATIKSPLDATAFRAATNYLLGGAARSAPQSEFAFGRSNSSSAAMKIGLAPAASAAEGFHKK